MKNKMKTPYLISTVRFILFLLLILGMCIFYSFYGNPLKAENSITDTDKSTAISLTNSIIDKTFNFVLNSNNPIQKKIEILRNNLISKVDLNFVSAFVLGPINRKMDDKGKDQFKKLFSDLMLYSYANKFSGYENYIAEVTGSEELIDNGHLYVNFIVYKKDNKDSTKIDCKVRWRKKGDNFNIIDMIVAGVSMSVTYRSEFKALLDNANTTGKNVVETLLTTLVSKVNAYKKGI